MTRRGFVLAGVGTRALLGQDLTPLLNRLSEEAEAFFTNITRVVGTETLRQKAMRTDRRFRPRIGSAAPPVEWRNKEVVSEFGVSLFSEGGGLLHELRKVQQVDGREVRKATEARMSLALDMRSSDDRIRRKLLLDLEQYGLTGAATDFTLSLLMFRKQPIRGFTFGPVTKTRLGADELLAVRFVQREGEGQFTVFEGNQTHRQKLQGEVWLRLPDGVPLRIILLAGTPGEKGVTIVDEGRVDYLPSAQGFLLPVAVVHRRFRNRELFLEEVYSYQRFQRFSADAEIRFEEVDAAPAVQK